MTPKRTKTKSSSLPVFKVAGWESGEGARDHELSSLMGYPASFQAITPPLRALEFLYPIPIYLAACLAALPSRGQVQ
jgi:hypothetical protein